jgi:plasmid stabilization system protein ParE
MAFEVKLTKLAEEDFDQILQGTLDRWGQAQYFKYAAKLLDAFALLAENPEQLLSKLRNDLYDGARLYPVGKHYLLYSVAERVVVVERILYQGMDLARHLGDLSE